MLGEMLGLTYLEFPNPKHRCLSLGSPPPHIFFFYTLKISQVGYMSIMSYIFKKSKITQNKPFYKNTLSRHYNTVEKGYFCKRVYFELFWTIQQMAKKKRIIRKIYLQQNSMLGFTYLEFPNLNTSAWV